MQYQSEKKMKMSKTKLNIGIGVLTGILVGFVLGTAFLGNESDIKTGGNASGNVSRLSRTHLINSDPNNPVIEDYNTESPELLDMPEIMESDSISLTATDAQGQNWKITISK